MAKKIKYLYDGVYTKNKVGRYVRAWKDGRSEIAVQIWNTPEKDGSWDLTKQPDGDWGMPKVLGITAAIEQALMQTEK